MIRIIESKYITSAVHPSGYPETAWKDFAFVGRSNVGKSSMINTITNRKLLAKIANKPGKTRLINFFEIKYFQESSIGALQGTSSGDFAGLTPFGSSGASQGTTHSSQHSCTPTENGNSTPPTPSSEGNNVGYFCLVDLPGYGYAKVSKGEKEHWQKMINTFFKERSQLAGVIVLVDIRHDPDPKDKIMIDMLKSMKINYMIATTKCDKIPKNKIPTYLKKFRNEFALDGVLIKEFSSLKKVGVESVLEWISSKMFVSETSGRVIVHE